MKKIHIFLITAMFQTALTHIPQNGPLILGDQVQVNQFTFMRFIKRGLIMNTIINNPDFLTELGTIRHFLNIPANQDLPSYEEIVDSLQISTNSYGSIAIIEAFERAIMAYLHYNHYICYTEGKNINIFFTGIKYNWFYPSEWIKPSSWISSCNSQEVRQLMYELEQLSNIVSKHSMSTSARLKAKIESYRNWKQNGLVCISALGAIYAGLYIKNSLFAKSNF